MLIDKGVIWGVCGSIKPAGLVGARVRGTNRCHAHPPVPSPHPPAPAPPPLGRRAHRQVHRALDLRPPKHQARHRAGDVWRAGEAPLRHAPPAWRHQHAAAGRPRNRQVAGGMGSGWLVGRDLWESRLSVKVAAALLSATRTALKHTRLCLAAAVPEVHREGGAPCGLHHRQGRLCRGPHRLCAQGCHHRRVDARGRRAGARRQGTSAAGAAACVVWCMQGHDWIGSAACRGFCCCCCCCFSPQQAAHPCPVPLLLCTCAAGRVPDRRV